MLEVRHLSVDYGKHRALDDVSIRVDKGEIVVILGANGAGKSTLLGAIAGTGEGHAQGAVQVGGLALLGAPAHEIVEEGIALVPEGRGVFGELTVRENLLLGAYAERARGDRDRSMERVLGLFPALRERLQQAVHTMSGGEQQMVAIGRAMMSSPAVLMLDEPSLGLSPLLCKELFRRLAEVRGGGLGILLVEQNARQSLAIADRGYLLENGRIVGAASAAQLAGDPAVQRAYLGAGGGTRPPPSPPASMPEPGGGTPIRPSSRPPPRVQSDALLPQSVATLVGRATALHARHVQAARDPAPARRDTVAGPGAGDRLQRVLAEIERAATAARLPRKKPDTGPGSELRFIEPRRRTRG